MSLGRQQLNLVNRLRPHPSGVMPGGTGMLLQRVRTRCAPSLRPLYWRVFRHGDDGRGPIRAQLQPDGSICIAPSTSLGFDTYFSAFFETHWWLHTRLSALLLRVVASGPCTIRVLRRQGPHYHLLHEETVSSDDHEPHEMRFVIEPEALNFRQYGLLFFEISAHHTGSARFIDASWHALDSGADCRLGLVICTFNRQKQLGAVLDSIAADPLALAATTRLLVVSQGEPGLASHPAIAPAAGRLGERLQIVEQPNLGGAGGFTRGMIEALDQPDLTHVGLLDDDIVLEADTLVRMQAFLSLAKDGVALGGQMLDSVQPMRLYEGGAIFDEGRWFVQPIQHDLDITRTDVLADLTELPAMHFNGWWCFAMPLEMLRRVGLPLPCFIRGDDAEFGTRLYKQGITTVSVPGTAVWHEPFYLKLGSWQLYYETRNLLVLGALHCEITAAGLVRRQVRHLMVHLLTFRYYSSALIIRAIADFLAGPDILRRDPRIIHAGLAEIATRYVTQTVPRESVLPRAAMPRLPRRRIGYLVAFVLVLLRSALLPVRARTLLRVPVGEFSWPTLRRRDAIVLDSWWGREMPVYRRSQRAFLELARTAIPVFWRLYRTGPGTIRRWREAAPELRSSAFWRTYLANVSTDR